MACAARAALMVVAACAGAPSMGLLVGSCRFDERGIGGPYLTGGLNAWRTTALPIETEIVIEVRVTLSDAARTPVAGRAVTLEVSGSANPTVTRQPHGETSSTGIVRGVISAGGEGEAVVQAYVLPPDLERVALPPLTLAFVADAGQTLLLSRATLDAGHTLAVAGGDVDGDGVADLVVLDDGPEPGVRAWRGGQGFPPDSALAADLSGKPAAMAVADFNGDGRADVAVGRADTQAPAGLDIVVSGSSGLAVGKSFELTSLPRAMAAGELDGRGAADLVVAEPYEHTMRAFYFDSAGVGGVQLRSNTTIAAGKDAVGLAIARVNGDDLEDLASALSTSSEVTITFGDGAGLGSAAATYAMDARPVAVGIGDLNDDGLSDIAVAYAGATGQGDALVVLLAEAASGPSTQPAFQRQPPKPLGGRPTAIAVGDLTGDHRADVAVLTQIGAPDGGRLEVFVQGTGDLYAARALAVPEGPLSVAIADWNADGKPDAAVASYGQPVTIFFGE